MKTENIFLSGFQWFIFLLANSIAIPIVIGDIFHFSEAELTSFMQRVFFMVGVSSFIQAKFGHRYPIADGPAGSWVSIFVLYASIGMQLGKPMTETLQILGAGIFISGLLLLFLGITKWVRYLLFLFTPIVTGTFLFILAVQLSGVFLKGMVLNNNIGGQIDIVSLFLSIIVFFLSVILRIKGKGWLKNYSILIGLLFGWFLFSALGIGRPPLSNSDKVLNLPGLFVWGFPEFNGGILITSLLFTFLLISNSIASISSAQEAVPNQKGYFQERLYSTTWAGGISHILATIFSSIGVVPLPATAGFVKLTKQYRIGPFLIACGALTIISLLPSITSKIASLPLPVASAVLLATLIDMFRIAVQLLTRHRLNTRNIIIGVTSILAGIGTIFLTDGFISSLPKMAQILCSNGLLIGTILAIFLEQTLKNKMVILDVKQE
ncbi:purine/pyrimidine permease [Schinkia azotoformans]|uniref:purine/pyrimidine permease n=1 Tax=Schinkia azotoformans TaxID=1454 RepID=UPI002DBE4646|nr:purine/pyrimidine permease [Schinkia azotoformans]MEC1717299.1 purine/pyrimidine permease [Schinkia azotoformans]MEC1739321.1 purine/pyrimidine permease [Schinkia azotoformans]MEC1747663.1 purine/pyrimidine permease [Schinkia azotoformans]MEC1760190.1 purine/pyrimidine permease [Schinkia azotoformans]MEC1764976.1 purine/pyrimidine permease [Schinkia azotoformans]